MQLTWSKPVGKETKGLPCREEVADGDGRKYRIHPAESGFWLEIDGRNVARGPKLRMKAMALETEAVARMADHLSREAMPILLAQATVHTGRDDLTGWRVKAGDEPQDGACRFPVAVQLATGNDDAGRWELVVTADGLVVQLLRDGQLTGPGVSLLPD